jgi:hypothetical protein
LRRPTNPDRARNGGAGLSGPVSGRAADCSTVGLTQGTSANVLVRAESRPAGRQAQQAQKPAVGADDGGPPTALGGHRPAHFGQVGLGRHRAACELPRRRGGGIIKRLAPGDAITFHDSLQMPGRADDQRGVDTVVAEEVSAPRPEGRPQTGGWPKPARAAIGPACGQNQGCRLSPVASRWRSCASAPR